MCRQARQSRGPAAKSDSGHNKQPSIARQCPSPATCCCLCGWLAAQRCPCAAQCPPHAIIVVFDSRWQCRRLLLLACMAAVLTGGGCDCDGAVCAGSAAANLQHVPAVVSATTGHCFAAMRLAAAAGTGALCRPCRAQRCLQASRAATAGCLQLP